MKPDSHNHIQESRRKTYTMIIHTNQNYTIGFQQVNTMQGNRLNTEVLVKAISDDKKGPQKPRTLRELSTATIYLP